MTGSYDDETRDPEVERLVDDIEETRNEMTGTVEEIGDRLDPKNIVADAKETVRAATVGKVEEMANTAGEFATDAGETVKEAGTSVIDTITRNPVPAAMIGLGIGWLVMSGQKNQNQSGRYQSGRDWQDGRKNGPDAIEQAKYRAGAVADDVGHKVGQAADRVGQLADEVPYQVKSTAADLGEQASQMYYSNPLAMGAIAVAVGTAVGLALPVTEVERKTLAQPARTAMSRAEEVATDALEQVETQARDVEDQAREEDRLSRPH